MEKNESGCRCIPHAGKNLMQYASSKCQVSNELKPWNPRPTKASKPKILCISLLIWEVLVHETWLFYMGGFRTQDMDPIRIPETDLVRHLIVSPHHIQLS